MESYDRGMEKAIYISFTKIINIIVVKIYNNS